MDLTLDPILETIWRFVRRDLPAREFEQWLYATALEERLGPEFYLEAISTDFADAEQLDQLRVRLEAFAHESTPRACQCMTLADLSVVDMAAEVPAVEYFDELARRGAPYWWLSAERCRVCGETWLVAQEERQNDVFCLHRLRPREVQDILERGKWPTDFDQYETLLELGLRAGHKVSFVDPIGDSSLTWTIKDLARARPGIRLSELRRLLNLDAPTARVLAEQVRLTTDVDIEFDDE
jgi:hypothetical protein